jgi:hypothetical protein
VLFVVFREANLAKLAELREKGKKSAKKLPLPKGFKILGNYATPGEKAFSIIEAEKEEDIFRWYWDFLPYLSKLEVQPIMPIDELFKKMSEA